MDAPTEHELLSRIAAGERSALGVLYDRHVRPVYRFALAELRSKEDAEDVTQETFLTLSARAGSIRLPAESVLPWLLVTCRNLCRNRQRARAREARRQVSVAAAAESEARDTPESAAERHALRDAVADAVRALSPSDQRLFELCIDGDASYQAAAESLGISHGGVRNRVSRIRARLRHAIDTNQEVHLR